MTTLRRASPLVLLALGAIGVLSGCKRHPPPPRIRVWLGPSHACSLQKTGTLECWGENGAGQLGDRSTASRALPAPVQNVTAKPNDLALGARHTCALTAGAVKCWGDGARGQLGTALTTPLDAPSVPVVFHGVPLAGATAIAAGGDRSCVLTPDGVVCWGEGVVEPAPVEGFRGVASLVTVGSGHTCAAFADPKAVRCTGADDRGQSAKREPLLAGVSLLGLAAGAKHTCALLADGSIQCWGANDQGQLGDGTTTDSHVPALVHGLPPAVEVRAGATFTCARLRNNTVACWGDNRAHQLVDGTATSTSKPQPVPGLVGVQELTLGGDSGCARLADGEVRCWGANASGQLGDGTAAQHDVPMPIKAASLPPK